MDKVVDWNVSTDGSLESFVIPENNIKYYTKMTASYCMSLSLYIVCYTRNTNHTAINEGCHVWEQIFRR